METFKAYGNIASYMKSETEWFCLSLLALLVN